MTERAACGVNIVVPVYADPQATRACLASVAATVGREHIIDVIDDASPDPAVALSLAELSGRYPQLRVTRNAVNLGFVGTANRGFGLHPDRDVILLNSDTRVAGDWVERLRAAAHSAQHIGTVTPFSNNATLCSYPKFLAANPLPRGLSLEAVDALFNETNRGSVVDLPTAVGFCMYIRRDCLAQVGGFDAAFGRGYGEENDFCLRARRRGWRNVLCADTYVFHAGGGSFGPDKGALERQGFERVVQRHPRYPQMLEMHFDDDPARPYRRRVDLRRLCHDPRAVTLLVSHDHGGGIRRHLEEWPGEFGARACLLLLEPAAVGEVRLSWFDPDEEFHLHFRLPAEWGLLLEFLRSLPVQRIHVHQLIGLLPEIATLPAALGVPFDFTAHDYYTICPRIRLSGRDGRYCGEPDARGCATCLAGEPESDIVAWRQRHVAVLEKAERVIAPSQDTARRLARYAPHARITALPLPDPGLAPRPVAAPAWPAERPLRILVLGALSDEKGAALLEACALQARNSGLSLDYHLIGYAWRQLAAVTVRGSYRDADLATLIAGAQADLIWFPALWPETYSYTLSAALNSGLPIVAPDLGAFPERLASRPWTWIMPWNTPPERWNEFFATLRGTSFAGTTAPVSGGSIASVGDRAAHCAVLVKTAGATPPSDRALEELAYPWRSGRERMVRRSRRAVLSFGLRLRRAPAIRWLAQNVPIEFQRRVARWIEGK